VSTTKQEANNQLAQMLPHCEKMGWEIYNQYVDIITGKEDSRPAWDLMFKEAHMHSFDLVLFWNIDRFSRSGTLFTLQKLKELENLGIGWKSFTEQYFDTVGPFKDVVISIMATLAKMEREKISQRTKAGLVGKDIPHKDRFGNMKQAIGKRGKDKKPRKWRADKGVKRNVFKSAKNRENMPGK
jgi:DNA invertase Pin-like site-specific DNA recombinase